MRTTIIQTLTKSLIGKVFIQESSSYILRLLENAARGPLAAPVGHKHIDHTHITTSVITV